MKKANISKKRALSRKEWLDTVGYMLYGSYHNIEATYQDSEQLSGTLKALGDRGLLEIPENLRGIIREAILHSARRLLDEIRSQSRRGDVSHGVKDLRNRFKNAEFPPNMVGTSLQELRELERRGCASRARATIASARLALKNGTVHANLFYRFEEVPDFMTRSGLPLQEFGFPSEDEFIAFGGRVARPFLRHTLQQWFLRRRHSEDSRKILEWQRKYRLSDEDIGLDRSELERVREEIRQRVATNDAAHKAHCELPEFRAATSKRRMELISQLRSGAPQSWDPTRCQTSLSGMLRSDGLKPEEVGSSEDELRQLQQRWPQLHGLYLADLYRAGRQSPKSLFEDLERLGVHPSMVGISVDEVKLFTT